MAKTDADVDADLVALAKQKLLGNTRRYTDQEALALDLYDGLNALKLEEAIVTAEGNGRLSDKNSHDLAQAQRDLLEARALYDIKRNVVDQVLQSQSIVPAVGSVHMPEQLEAGLEIMIHYRDNLAMVHESLQTALHGILDELTVRQAENLSITRTNRELAAELLEIAGEADEDKLEGLDDSDLSAELEAARGEEKEQRQRYRIIKGLTTGVVVGSGVNWAADEQLRNLVLDLEE